MKKYKNKKVKNTAKVFLQEEIKINEDKKTIKRFFTEILLWIYVFTIIVPFISTTYAVSDEVKSPFKQVSKLECRFQEYASLDSNCKQELPNLKTSDYKKYATENGWYNDYTRYFTVLWWSSYKYGWDVWNGWHQWTDIATAKWTPVYSVADWKVIVASEQSGWWKVVSVEHTIRWKKVVSNYAHLSKIDVSVWDKVSVWNQIWEVGSTWNSTWNHLHFQIDLESANNHPYYPDSNTCPYSYYKMTEEWVCFDDLAQKTVDPLLFLETKWAILDSIKIETKTVSRDTFSVSSSIKTSVINSSSSNSIFDKTVYIWYPEADIKEVQTIFKNLWLYNGSINGKYEDLEFTVYNYQVAKWIVKTKQDAWAGRFWPKTRAQVNLDYNVYLAKIDANKSSKTISNNTTTIKVETPKIEKIERKNILTREQIEAREIDDFLNIYKIDAYLDNIGWNIAVWQSQNLHLDIKSKSKDKPFRWNTPLDITFSLDSSIISTFPIALYNFTDGQRDVKLTWIKNWSTVLKVKLWNRVIKSIDLKTFENNATLYPARWTITAPKTIVIWEMKKAAAKFRTDKDLNLINLSYGSTFTLKWVWDTLVCMKSWDIKDLAKIYTSNCKESDFVKEKIFSYKDTVWWIVVFEYKSTWLNTRVDIMNNYNNSFLASQTMNVSMPKWLKNTYAYYDDVASMLKANIVSIENKWYFLQDRELTKADAVEWISNSLTKMKTETIDQNKKVEIAYRIEWLTNEISNSKVLTRQDFLDLSYKYLSFWESESIDYKTYRDLDDVNAKKLAFAFDGKTIWKDEFGENYFRPTVKITRWEASFMLNKAYTKQRQLYLAVK